MSNTQKAKRRLTNIDFTEKGSHLALVHKDQGGSANGYDTLIMKTARTNLSPESVKKAAQVKITLSFEEFLEKFFDMWGSQAKVLATLLGMQDEDEQEDSYYKDYVEEQVEKFEILKAAHTATSKTDFLANLPEDDYVALLQGQEQIEKAFAQLNKGDGKTVVSKKATPAIHKKEKTKMAETEMIAKSQYEEVLKASELQKEQLLKATAMLAELQEKEKVQVAKARKDTLVGAVETEEVAEKLFKAVADLDDANFQAVVEVVKAMNAKVDNASFFEEQGANGKENPIEYGSPIAKALHTRLSKAQQ